MNNNRTIITTSIITSLLTAAVVLSGTFAYLKRNPELVVGQQAAVLAAPSSQNSVVEIIKQASPAVVSITITKNVPIIERYFRQYRPFGGLWGGILNIPQYRQLGTETIEVGGGSGFFISPDGYIITNRHVVDDPEAEYTVFTNDGNKHSASVVARDPNLDIAVIKIPGNGYSHLQFGDSNTLQVGETAISIGNALGEFRNTVSVGVISGLGRSITAGSGQSTEEFEQLIQTDAAINRGNSGGPLLNLKGEVIGVNVAVASGAENIGFALPANGIKEVLRRVLESQSIN